MRFTKTAEELQERRAKVSAWTRNGQVMNDNMRKAIQNERKRQQSLEEKADMIIAGLNTSNKPKARVKTVQSQMNEGSVRNLSRDVKSDQLAMMASQIIQELTQ